MIGYLRGNLIEKNSRGFLLLDVGGVGYEVQCSNSTIASLGESGNELALFVHTRVREDAISLFGFVTSEEKRTFDALLSAHGVGPSLALSLLNMHSPMELRSIVAMDDSQALSQVPGVGKKTAARLLVELKSKFDVYLDDELVDIVSTTKPLKDSNRSDVVAALNGLGYSGEEIRSAMQLIPKEGDVQDLLKMALRELAAN